MLTFSCNVARHIAKQDYKPDHKRQYYGDYNKRENIEKHNIHPGFKLTEHQHHLNGE